LQGYAYIDEARELWNTSEGAAKDLMVAAASALKEELLVDSSVASDLSEYGLDVIAWCAWRLDRLPTCSL
jgi:hypothetical protein